MKKRYQLTLTVENVENFQKIGKILNLSQDAMSKALDASLADMVKVFDMNKEIISSNSTGTFSMKEIIGIFSNHLASNDFNKK